jgi:hypothetical protein
MPPSPRRLALVSLAIALWLALVAGHALTQEPFVDEAWNALPAWNLATNGSMGSPVLEPMGSPMPGMKISLKGLREHTYWLMPLPTICLAGWYRLVGFSLFTTRMYTALWMVVVLVAWYAILRQLSGDELLAALGVVLIATDSWLLGRTAFGRMDVMSAAFGFSGVAAYLRLRERSLAAAVIASQTLVMLAGLSHPNGGIVCGFGLLAVTLALDARRLRWRHLGLAAVPYGTGGLAMAVYILQAPDDFFSQFLGQATGAGRFAGLRSPLNALWREAGRYAEPFGFGQSGRVKILVFGAYMFSAVCVCWNGEARRRYRPLLVLAGTAVAALTLLENLKSPHYLIYTLPMLCALVAVTVRGIWVGRYRRIAYFAAAALICLQVGGILRLMAVRNTYADTYLPAIHWIHANVPRQTLIMGDSALFFDLGTEHLIDDIRLGYLTGNKPGIVIVNERYQDFFNYLKRDEPDAWRHIQCYLYKCRAIPISATYTAYVPRTPPLPSN